MNRKELSVIVIMATYNGKKYIKHQIESVLAQKKVSVQLLIRDDGSIDGTQKILQEYKSKGALDWYTGEHLNVAKGFIELLKNSPVADYYAFCDQDDVWEENKLFSAINKLDKEEEDKPMMYYSSTTLVDDSLKFIKKHSIRTNRNDLARFLFNDMSGNTMVINSRLRDLILKNDFLDITIHDKWILQLCLSCGGKCLGDINSYILYRMHGNNTIGMELTFKSKIRKFFRIINSESDIHLLYLHDYYFEHLIEPYSSLIKIVSGGKISILNRLCIAFDKDIIFGGAFFRLAFIIRILKGKL